MKKILVLNSGSSSLKYQLFNVDGDNYTVIAKGNAERIGIYGSFVSLKIGNGEKVIKEELIGIKDKASIYQNMAEFGNQGLVVSEIEDNNNVMGYVSLEALAGNDKIKGTLGKYAIAAPEDEAAAAIDAPSEGDDES